MSTKDVQIKQQRSFTGDKLDWMTALSADPRLNARAFEIGFQIAQHVNKATGLAILSDDTLADKSSIPKRWVARARTDLREAGWIDWKRTKTANIYWTKGEHMDAITDHQIMLSDARKERRKKHKTARQVLPPVAYLKIQDQPPVANADLPPVADRELPQVADIHLSGNTVVETPSKKDGLGEVELIEEVVGDDDWL